ncbi:MAG: hypothetical protein K2L57_04625 [Muribaculaceae bacterium]|nr:hypothetical protein [Muribaculaceae bacterium]
METIIISLISLAVGAATGILAGKVRSGKLYTRIGILESQLSESRAAAEESLRRMEETHGRVMEEREKAHALMLRDRDRSW